MIFYILKTLNCFTLTKIDFANRNPMKKEQWIGQGGKIYIKTIELDAATIKHAIITIIILLIAMIESLTSQHFLPRELTFLKLVQEMPQHGRVWIQETSCWKLFLL